VIHKQYSVFKSVAKVIKNIGILCWFAFIFGFEEIKTVISSVSFFVFFKI